MIRILKKIWIVIALVLLLPFVFVGGGVKTFADNTIHYIKNTILVSAEGKVNVSLIMSCEFPSTFTAIDREKFKTQLVSYLNSDLLNKKAKIEAQYAQETNEKYNPSECIVFGDNGQAVKAKDYVGYNIEYSSVDVFKYYNNISTTYKKGFFLDKSSQVLDNPFNDQNENSGTFITEADRYKAMYINAAEDVGLDSYVKENYKPYYYNDYVTLSRRTKSNAHSVVQDKDNYYHHIWVSDGETLTNDDEMLLTLNIIHSGWWYLLGISIPLVVMGVAIVVVKITGKSKVKVNKVKENVED